MLISHRFKFLIIDIPKTGTCSRRLALKKYCDIIGGTKNDLFYQHDTAISLRGKFTTRNWQWDEYFKYVTVRNPWARYASWYVWGKNIYETNIKTPKKDMTQSKWTSYNRFKNILSKNNFDTHETLKATIKSGPAQAEYFFYNGKILVDYVATAECMTSDFNYLCDKVCISPTPSLQHKNQNASYHYKDFYNQELIDLVAEKEKYVIDHCGYQY